MMLAGEVPATIGAALRSGSERVLSGASPDDFDLWAVHPGGRTVLDALREVGHSIGQSQSPQYQNLR